MQTVLIVVHLVIVLALVAVVLLQRSEGGLGLGGGGGGGFMTGRGQANALTRATAIFGGLFFLTSMVLSIVAHHSRAPRSILDNAPAAPAAAPALPGGAPAREGQGILNDLRRLQGEQPPAAPAESPQVPQSR